MGSPVSRLRNVARAIATLACLGATVTPRAHAAPSVADFYKGQTISIMIPYPPGGSYDMYARIAAQRMGAYIPGHPTVIVQNRSGGVSTLRSFANISATDGTVMAIFPETIGIIQLTDPAIGQWDVRRLAYVGSFAPTNIALIIRKGAPATTIAALRTTRMNVGCNSPISEAYVYPALLKNLQGDKFHIICGYAGTSEFPIALERGEIDLVSGTWAAWRNAAEIRNGDFKVLIQAGLKPSPELPGIPLMQDLVADPEQKKIIAFWSSGSAIGRALLVRSDVPADRIAALRAAFDATVKDPDFLAQARKSGIVIDPSTGAAVQKVSEDIMNTPKPLVQQAVAAAK